MAKLTCSPASVVVIRRRFVAGLANFFTLFEPVADSWQMFDNADTTGLRLIAARKPGSTEVVHDQAAWQRLKDEAR